MTPPPASIVWLPVQPQRSLAHRVATRVDELIASEQLHAGDRLPAERELAGLLGVSRPSLREALKVLAAQGRVSVRHGQGVFVEADVATRRLRDGMAEMTVDFDEVYAMREVLEVPAAGWAAEKATPQEIEIIAAALEALTVAIGRDPTDWDQLQHLDAAFHESVVRAAGNKFMLRTLGVLNEIMLAGMSSTLRLPGRLTRSAADHARILRAIRSGDPRAARAAARAHIRAAQLAAQRHSSTSEQSIP